jgi:hypothetical protein
MFVRNGETLPTGRVKGGYRYIKVGGREYQAHRLAHYYMTGEYPPPEIEIDHKDSNSLNNRWDNLQPITRTGNRRKRATPKAYRKAVAPYVYPSRKHPARYEAFVRFGGRKYCCGQYHSTIEDAVSAQRLRLSNLEIENARVSEGDLGFDLGRGRPAHNDGATLSSRDPRGVHDAPGVLA